MSKGSRRREARRRAKRRREERERPPGTEGAAAEDAGEEEPSGGGGEPVHAAEAGGAHSRAARKQAKRRVGLWTRVSRVRVSPWLLATPVLGVITIVVVLLILSGGSSGTMGGGAVTPTPDPRVAGQTPEAVINIDVDDVAFRPDTISANAGEVIELVVTNTGTISHNLTVAGPDNEYGTDDDFEPQPFAIKVGETRRLLVKMDDPDRYLFRCAFHPTIETGILILE